MASLEKVKSGKNFIVYESGDQKLIKIENIRFSYPCFGTPKEDEGEDGSKRLSWQGVAMLPKATHKEAKDAFMEIVAELERANDKKVEPQYRCIKNGDDKEDEAMHGHWLISFSERTTNGQGRKRQRPAARNAGNEVISDVEDIDEAFYGGCWGHVLLRPLFFAGQAKGKTKQYPKRISCGYQGVQKTRDDTPFGGGRIDDTDAWGAEDGASGGSSGSSAEDDDGL